MLNTDIFRYKLPIDNDTAHGCTSSKGTWRWWIDPQCFLDASVEIWQFRFARKGHLLVRSEGRVDFFLEPRHNLGVRQEKEGQATEKCGGCLAACQNENCRVGDNLLLVEALFVVVA